MIISTKQDISNLAKGLKSYLDSEVGFPLKLSKAHDAVSILFSGLNHQSLIKALPYTSSSHHIDELQTYFKQVHQKQLDDIQLEYLSFYELTEGLIRHNEHLSDLIHGVKSNTAVICVTIYSSERDSFYGDTGVIFDVDVLNEQIPVKVLGGSLVSFGSESVGSYSFMEHMSEVLSDVEIDGSNGTEHNGYAFNDIVNFLTSERKLNFIGDSQFAVYDEDDDSEGSWSVDIPKFTLAGFVELSEPIGEEIYKVIDDESSLFQALQQRGYDSPVFAEISISPMSSGIHGAYVELDNPEELSWLMLGDSKRGNDQYQSHKADFGSNHRALSIIKNLVENQKGLSACVPISFNGSSVGAIEITHPNEYKFVMPNFEELYCDIANMSTSSHHFDGKTLQVIFPGIQAYQVKANHEHGNIMFLDSNCELSFFQDEPALDINKDFCEVIPALYNAMSERVNHWEISGISTSELIHSADKTIFETHCDELIESCVDFIIVDDFQELYGDLSSVMTVGFYKEGRLVVELSYSIIMGAKKDEPLKEFMLDNAIKGFSKKHNIPYRWHEHTVNHPMGERHLSHLQSEYTLLPTEQRNSVRNSLIIVAMEISLPTPNSLLDYSAINLSHAHELIRPLLVNNVHKKNQDPEPFNFCSAQVPDIILTTKEDIDLITEAFTKAHSNGLEKVSIQTESVIKPSVGLQIIYGAFDLKGKPMMETHNMMSNLLAHYEKASDEDKKDEHADDDDSFLHWNDSSFRWGEKILLNESQLEEWKEVYGVKPDTITMQFWNMENI